MHLQNPEQRTLRSRFQKYSESYHNSAKAFLRLHDHGDANHAIQKDKRVLARKLVEFSDYLSFWDSKFLRRRSVVQWIDADVSL